MDCDVTKIIRFVDHNDLLNCTVFITDKLYINMDSSFIIEFHKADETSV